MITPEKLHSVLNHIQAEVVRDCTLRPNENSVETYIMCCYEEIKNLSFLVNTYENEERVRKSAVEISAMLTRLICEHL